MPRANQLLVRHARVRTQSRRPWLNHLIAREPGGAPGGRGRAALQSAFDSHVRGDTPGEAVDYPALFGRPLLGLGRGSVPQTGQSSSRRLEVCKGTKTDRGDHLKIAAAEHFISPRGELARRSGSQEGRRTRPSCAALAARRRISSTSPALSSAPLSALSEASSASAALSSSSCCVSLTRRLPRAARRLDAICTILRRRSGRREATVRAAARMAAPCP